MSAGPMSAGEVLGPMSAGPMIPDEVLGPDGRIELNAGALRTNITEMNAGDRPVQVGSHYHFAETNPALRLDRVAVRG